MYRAYYCLKHFKLVLVIHSYSQTNKILPILRIWGVGVKIIDARTYSIQKVSLIRIIGNKGIGPRIGTSI